METKLIDYRLYDPKNSLFGNKNDRAVFTTLHCSNSESCPALAIGKCAVWHGLGGTNCPYGKRNREEGFTRRAMKFNSWLNERKKRVADICQLKSLDKIMTIGDYVFFPYPYWSLNMKGIDQRYRSGFFQTNDKFLPREMFTIDLFEQIINARPQAMMGGEIRAYQHDTVPKIIMHTEENMNEFFNQWCDKYPETAKKYSKRDYVGRKALLKTVRGGSVFPHKDGSMTWDGEKLIVNNYTSIFLPVKGIDCAVLTIKPKENTTIEITDNNQVLPSTVFS